MYRIPNVAKIVPTVKTRSRNLKLETRQIPELGLTNLQNLQFQEITCLFQFNQSEVNVCR